MHGRVEACRSRTCTAAFCSRRLFRCRDTLPQNKKPRAAKKERASRDESEGEADKLENVERFTSSLETNIILQVGSFPKVPSDVRSLLVKLDVQRSFSNPTARCNQSRLKKIINSMQRRFYSGPPAQM